MLNEKLEPEIQKVLTRSMKAPAPKKTFSIESLLLAREEKCMPGSKTSKDSVVPTVASAAGNSKLMPMLVYCYLMTQKVKSITNVGKGQRDSTAGNMFVLHVINQGSMSSITYSTLSCAREWFLSTAKCNPMPSTCQKGIMQNLFCLYSINQTAVWATALLIITWCAGYFKLSLETSHKW